MITCGARNEYGKLKAVLLCRPPSGVTDPEDPKDVLHPERIDYEAIRLEIDSIAIGLKELGINIFTIDTAPISGTGRECFYNIMYVRDLFSLAGEKCLLARMQSRIRREETIYAKKTLKDLGLQVSDSSIENATFEGADMLWISDCKAMIGVGGRTNEAGYELVSSEAEASGCETVKVKAPSESLHLLGSVQIVDKDLAFVRGASIGDDIRQALDENDMRIIEIAETEEVVKKHAMNFVSIAPKKIIISSNVPETKELFTEAGIEVVKEFGTYELIKGGGSLACAVGILKRER